MRIAQIAPPIESVPPAYYGGTERVVSYLTEELVRQGHEVTLFASGDSLTSAELVATTSASLRLTPAVQDVIPYYLLTLDKVRERADEFDILHFHIDQFHFPIFRPIAHRTLTTLHGRQDLPDLQALYRGFGEMPLVSISNAQREPAPTAGYVATVYHGIPTDLHQVNLNPRGNYLAFLGRICPEKRVDHAIAIARASGIPLKIAAKVDKVDEAYFRETIVPLLNGPGVEFVGEINERAKTAFLGEALTLLFPIDWPEPFGLVMIEAMACGTPVIAYRCASVPEIVEPGVTGFIVDNVCDAVQAVDDARRLDRALCRSRFEERFSAARMAEDYLRIYERLLKD
jgi:glycosyltransferase involved in cell wall biosynthesis